VSRTLERDGARIAYDVSGPEGAPAVLLGHSLLCNRRMWDRVVPALAERYRVVNIEARGHGDSTAPAPFTLDDLAADWLAILDAEKLPRATLCGLSMGGMTAMRVALRAPDRVHALAILDSSADRELPTWRRWEYRGLAEIIRTLGHVDPIYKIARNKLLGATSRKEQPDLGPRVIGWIKSHNPPDLYHVVRAVFDRPSIHARIGAIRCPTLVLCGEEDVSTPLRRSERIAAAIPGAKLRLLPRTGHLSALESPAQVLAELEPFLARPE
jgi:pimeloyl-ACP methyl ester carboxylesterase